MWVSVVGWLCVWEHFVLNLFVCVCVCACVYMCVHACMHATHTCVQAHSHVYACRHMCIRVCVHVCMHVHVCISPSQSKLNYFIFSIMGKKLKLWAPPKIKPGDEKKGERMVTWEWQEQHDGNMMLVKVVRYIWDDVTCFFDESTHPKYYFCFCVDFFSYGLGLGH